MSNQTNDYRIVTPQQQLPEGRFPLTLCVTKDEVEAMLTALNAYSSSFDRPDSKHIQALHNALGWSQTPEYAPCAPCSDPEAQCISYYPHNPRFEFSPGVINGGTNNPPPGYIQNPWFTGDRYTVPGFNLLPTDVLCDFFSVASPFGFLQQIFQGGFPRFRFSWTGEATIEVHLIGVPLGGIAIARIDEGAQVDIYDLASITPSDLEFSLSTILQLIEGVTETNFVPISIHEIEVKTPGNHVLDVLFIPTVELSLLPVGWGGGVRKVVVCGKDVDCTNQECIECPECPDCPSEDDCGCDEEPEFPDDCGCN